jgi:anti-anti-sigma factor
MSEPFWVQVTTATGYTLVRVGGEIDLCTAPELRAEVYAAIAYGARELIVDLTDVTFIDASGLHVLAYALRQLGSQGVRVVARRTNVRRVFTIRGMR